MQRLCKGWTFLTARYQAKIGIRNLDKGDYRVYPIGDQLVDFVYLGHGFDTLQDTQGYAGLLKNVKEEISKAAGTFIILV